MTEHTGRCPDPARQIQLAVLAAVLDSLPDDVFVKAVREAEAEQRRRGDDHRC